MKPGGGRNKGNGFEREVSKLIVAAFEDFGVTSEDCYRTPSSGGHKFARKVDPGDLCLSDKLKALFPFSVECKSYKGLPWHLLFDMPETCIWVSWWLQAKEAASRSTGVRPLVVFKQNRTQVFAILQVKNPVSYGLNTRYGKSTLAVIPFDGLLSIMKSKANQRKAA